MKHFLSACTVISTLTFTACASAQGEPFVADEAQGIHEELQRMSEESGFSGAVIIERDGEPILEAGYGIADAVTGAPFTIHTVAQIDSNSKQFTSLIALMLVEDGVLDLNAPISTYLPEVPAHTANITLAQLMTHSAGLPGLCGTEDFRRLSREDMLQECLAGPLLFEPGTNSEYSNVGFSVIAAIVERVTGEHLEDLLRARVWEPNHLDTFGYYFPADSDYEFARAVREDETPPYIHERLAEMDGNFWVLKGNGGLQASADDMRNWHHVMRGEGTLSDEFLNFYMTPAFETSPGEYEGYGLLIVTGSDGNIAQVSHAGSDNYFFSYIYWDRQNDMFLYIVGNSGEEVTTQATIAALRGMQELVAE